MADNEKTGFKARELKSVHVDAVGRYLRLVVHKNHVNKYNLYNQVGQSYLMWLCVKQETYREQRNDTCMFMTFPKVIGL